MVIALSAADQTVVADARIPLVDLAAALAEVGMALPLGESPGMPPLLGDALLMGLPHTLEAQTGTWRQWILGGRVLLPDGARGFVGAKVVKSVAGYDLHKFLVGSRGSFGRFEEVVLRVTPLGAVPPSLASRGPAQTATVAIRVRRSLFPSFLEACGETVHLSDPASSTVWLNALPSSLPEDAVVIPLTGETSLDARSERVRSALSGSLPRA